MVLQVRLLEVSRSHLENWEKIHYVTSDQYFAYFAVFVASSRALTIDRYCAKRDTEA